MNKDNTDRLETKRKKKGESRDLSQQGGILQTVIKKWDNKTDEVS